MIWATLLNTKLMRNGRTFFPSINLLANMLMLERKGRPLIFYITFASQEQNNMTKDNDLYWFPNDEERAYHEEDGVYPDGVFTQVDDGWYIVETTRSR